MRTTRFRFLLLALAATAMVAAVALLGSRESAQAQSTPRFSNNELRAILNAAEANAVTLDSLFRLGPGGIKLKTKMHIAICDRIGRLLAIRSMNDAWEGSIDIAIAKARTAALFSSNENALSSRDIGILSQAHFNGGDGRGEAGPLWGIWHTNQFPLSNVRGERNGLVTFPGGLPLYKNNILAGGVGVSGDGVDQDEAVAIAGSRAGQAAVPDQAVGFEAPLNIRSSKALPGILTYTKP
jgi:uncharacterized protein GlcG (DUF336 family)